MNLHPTSGLDVLTANDTDVAGEHGMFTPSVMEAFWEEQGTSQAGPKMASGNKRGRLAWDLYGVRVELR